MTVLVLLKPLNGLLLSRNTAIRERWSCGRISKRKILDLWHSPQQKRGLDGCERCRLSAEALNLGSASWDPLPAQLLSGGEPLPGGRIPASKAQPYALANPPSPASASGIAPGPRRYVILLLAARQEQSVTDVDGPQFYTSNICSN